MIQKVKMMKSQVSFAVEARLILLKFTDSWFTDIFSTTINIFCLNEIHVKEALLLSMTILCLNFMVQGSLETSFLFTDIKVKFKYEDSRIAARLFLPLLKLKHWIYEMFLKNRIGNQFFSAYISINVRNLSFHNSDIRCNAITL